jgi:hypothetical protein
MANGGPQNMFWKLNRVEEFDPLTTVFHMTAFADDSKARMDVTIRGSDLIEEIAGGSAFGDMFKIVYDTDDDGKVNLADFADVAGSVEWENIQDAPIVFPPEAHVHLLEDITDAGDLAAVDSVGTTQIDANAVTLPKLAKINANQILGRGTAGTGDVEVLTLGSTLKITAGNVLNADLSELGGGDMLGSNNLGDVSDPATSFDNIKQDATDSYSGVVTLAENKGTTAGTVVQATDDRLSDAREPTAHTHEIEDVDELTEALAEKAEVVHTHAIEDVTDLSSTLSGKANATHSHIISDVTGLQTALNNKADASHNHDGSAITTGEVSLARGGTATSLTAPSDDALLAYDKSASKMAFFGLGTGLKFNDVTLELDGVQLTDPMLSDWLGLEWAENTLPYVDGPDSFALTSITAMGRGILAADDATTLAAAAGLGTAAFLDAGTGSGNVITGADARLTDARTPTSHTHTIADLPVATSGESSSSKLTRADDSRLSNSRAPTGAASGDLNGTYPSPLLDTHLSPHKIAFNPGWSYTHFGFELLFNDNPSAFTLTRGSRAQATLVQSDSGANTDWCGVSAAEDPASEGDVAMPVLGTSYDSFLMRFIRLSGSWTTSQAQSIFVGRVNVVSATTTPVSGAFVRFRVDGANFQAQGVRIVDSTEYTTAWATVPTISGGGYWVYMSSATQGGEMFINGLSLGDPGGGFLSSEPGDFLGFAKRGGTSSGNYSLSVFGPFVYTSSLASFS